VRHDHFRHFPQTKPISANEANVEKANETTLQDEQHAPGSFAMRSVIKADATEEPAGTQGDSGILTSVAVLTLPSAVLPWEAGAMFHVKRSGLFQQLVRNDSRMDAQIVLPPGHRFHDSNRIGGWSLNTHRPHPEEARSAVSKDGRWLGLGCGRPSRRAQGALLRTRLIDASI
jgi:hypothetical protein